VNDVNNIRLDLLALSPGSHVLDLGCAAGDQTLELARRGLRVVGADIDRRLLDRLEHRIAEEKLACHTLLIDVQEGLPVPAGTFDAVVSTEVLEHVMDYRKAIAELVRVLKPGGRACVAVPTALSELVFHRIHPTYVRDSTHVNVFSRALLVSELRAAGLEIVSFERRNFEWSVFWLLHGCARSRFDHTGTPIEHFGLTRLYWRMRRVLRVLRVEHLLISLGNRVFPKSIYVYATKPEHKSIQSAES
jgi:SAM-dependent methyltransferase